MVELPEVVIVGRPNVGKSTLMNRILQRREAIVENISGVTRDRKSAEAEWQGRDFLLVDTGGWKHEGSGSTLDDKVTLQSEAATRNAAVILFVVDARIGLTAEDQDAIAMVRSATCPVLLVVNKVDTDAQVNDVWDFMKLGLGEPYGISSMHGRGVADLLDDVVKNLPDYIEPPEEVEGERIFSVALVGRPNVGKSTLFNYLIGEERSVVHDMAGTTRDTVDTVVDTDFGPIRFLDTAGMRRKSRISEDTEFYSVLRSLKSVDKADVALLLLDGSEGVTQQDQRLAERVDAAGCPIVVVINKTDLIDTEQKLDLDMQLKRKLNFLPNITVHRICATNGKGVSKILPSLDTAIGNYQTRIPTQKVNKIVRLAQQSQPAPGGARILYATQGATDPPTFTLFTNRKLHESYVRYIERELRDQCELGTVPIKIRVRLRNE